MVRGSFRPLIAMKLSIVLASLLVTSMFAVGCTTGTSYYGAGPTSDGGTTPSTGPLIDAEKLGGRCSGYGTSIGDTAAFPTDDCPAGMCVADARSGLDLFCSADCSNARCPEGWVCETTSVSSKKVCLKGPDYEPPKSTKDQDAAVADYRDQKLVGYRAEFSTSMRLSLRDFADEDRADVDLVVLMLGGLWEPHSARVLDEKLYSDWKRVRLVSVLIEGTQPAVGATSSNIIAWRNKHPGHNMLLDPSFTTLAPLFDGDIDALPIFIGLDAKTLEPVGQSKGVIDETDVEAWRDKLPK